MWKPLPRRTIILGAGSFARIGIILTYTYAPDYYVDRYPRRTAEASARQETCHGFFRKCRAETARGMMRGCRGRWCARTSRIVPFFIKTRYKYVAVTAYVLAGLIVWGAGGKRR